MKSLQMGPALILNSSVALVVCLLVDMAGACGILAHFLARAGESNWRRLVLSDKEGR